MKLIARLSRRNYEIYITRCLFIPFPSADDKFLPVERKRGDQTKPLHLIDIDRIIFLFMRREVLFYSDLKKYTRKLYIIFNYI